MNYINGDDILDYDISLLENDMQFMMMVIDVSNDKNMYYLCGDELLNNFQFIKYLIIKFHADADFILKVGKEYIDRVDESQKIEMKILLCSYLNDFDSVDYMKFKFDLELFYIRHRLAYQTCLEEFGDIYYDTINSMGFDMLLEDYSSSDTIKEYLAKKMLEEVFNFSSVELEKMVHFKFKNKNDLTKMGINSFLIQYVNDHDECLAGYLSVHVNLLLHLNKKITKILNNWDKYEFITSREKLEIVLEEIDKFVSENMYFIGCELEILKYILIKFDLKKVFLISGINLNYFDSEFVGNLDDIAEFDISKCNLELCAKFVKFIDRIKSICQLGIVPDDYIEEVTKPRRGTGKILKLENKNSN